MKAYVGMLALLCVGCEYSEEVSATRNAVTGGDVADSSDFDAVMCLPRYRADGVESGWDRPILRCVEATTLVTPNIVMGGRTRILVHSLQFELGTRTRNGAPVDDLVRGTAFEIGSAVNAVDDGPGVLRHATGCLEMRRSGLAPCCSHPYSTDPDLGIVRGQLGFDRPNPRVYIPPPELWDVPYDDPAHGVDVVGGYNTYERYLRLCAEPLAPDDDVVSDVIFLRLSERIDESLITPIPLALAYPDGSTNPDWFAASGAAGDVVGFGFGTPGETAAGNREGIRRVALAATVLDPARALLSPGEPDSLNALAWRFPANGAQFEVSNRLLGDGGRGANHVDYGAPWMFDDGTGRRVYAESSNGIAIFDVLYDTHLTPETAAYLAEFFDPDGDGLLRGVADAHLPGRIDLDGDGLSEARITSSGERVATGNDNCAPPAGSDPADAARFADATQLDRDGDGIGDVCDVCPEVYDPGQEGCRARMALDADESPTGVALEVGDIVGAACVRRRDAVDADADGVFDLWCDNCVPDGGLFDGRRTANPNQEDSDGDGVGDVCDVCPELSDQAASDPVTGDLDDDGVGDFCGDNCVGISNPLQQNCNAEAEIESGLFDLATLDPPGVGDACDPVPCGETNIETYAGVREGELRDVSLQRVLVHPRSDDELADVRTGFRFCRCDVASADRVQTRLDCVVAAAGGCAIDDRLSYDAIITVDAEEPASWRSMALRDHSPAAGAALTLADPDIGAVHEGLRVEATLDQYPMFSALDGFNERLVADWRHELDRSRWNDVFGEDASELRGVLWTHSPGQTTAFFDSATRSLTHHYWSGFIPAELEVPGPLPCLQYVGPWFGASGCPICESAFPAPFFGNPGVVFDGGCGGPFSPPVIEVPAPPIEVADFFSVDPRAAFARADVTWLRAAEPLEWTRDTAAVLVGLDPALAPAVVVGQGPNGRFLFDDQGNPCPTPNNCDRPPPPPVVFVNGAPADPINCVPVLSSREGEIFTLAGDAETRDGSVHRRSAVVGDAGTMRPAKLGRVLAATYRPEDRFLYVLDEVVRGSRRRHTRRFLRLVQLAPEGPSRVLRRWPRIARNTRFHLAPATTGGLWLLASRDRGPHVVAHLARARRRWKVDGIALRPSPVALVSPHVDSRGISYVVESRDRSNVVGATLHDLWRPRRRELRRCF